MNGTAIATDPDELLVTAFHEAAHAITAAVVGVPVIHATIEPTTWESGITALGHVRHWAMPRPNPVEAWLESTWVRAQLRILLAGYLIEDVIDPEYRFGIHIGLDHRDAWRLLYTIDPGHPERATMVAMQERQATAALLRDPRNADMICDLADRLLADRQVSGRWIHDTYFGGGCGVTQPEHPDLRCDLDCHRFGEHHNYDAGRSSQSSEMAQNGPTPALDDLVTWPGFKGPPRKKIPVSAYPPAHKRIVYFLQGGPTTQPPKRWDGVLRALQGSPA